MLPDYLFASYDYHFTYLKAEWNEELKYKNATGEFIFCQNNLLIWEM